MTREVPTLGLLVPLVVTVAGCIFIPKASPGIERGPLSVSLRVNLRTTKAQAQLGETVRLEIEVRNRGNRPIELTLRGRPAYEFVITTRDGTEVWHWPREQVSQDVSKVVKLYQRDQLDLKAKWDQVNNYGQPVSPGTYWVRGILHLEESQAIETQSVLLLIQPGPPLALRLEIPSSTPTEPFWKLGQKLPLKLKLKNISDQPVGLTLLGQPAYDFVVTQGYDGPEVWRWSQGKAIQEIAELRTLAPNEELEFVEAWDLRDNAGTPILPGRYAVRGLLNVEPPGKLETNLSFVTIGAGLPLRLTLEAPKEVPVGEIVPLKLRIENTSGQILNLEIGYAPYDFIVATQDGKEVWRWTYGKVFPLIALPLTLQPGEVKEYSEMWDQLDNEGYPIPPGTYFVKGVFSASQLEGLFETEQSEPQRLVIKRLDE